MVVDSFVSDDDADHNCNDGCIDDDHSRDITCDNDDDHGRL